MQGARGLRRGAGGGVMTGPQIAKVRATVDRFGRGFAANRFGAKTVARCMPAKISHRKYVRRLRQECVEEAQRRA